MRVRLAAAAAAAAAAVCVGVAARRRLASDALVPRTVTVSCALRVGAEVLVVLDGGRGTTVDLAAGWWSVADAERGLWRLESWWRGRVPLRAAVGVARRTVTLRDGTGSALALRVLPCAGAGAACR